MINKKGAAPDNAALFAAFSSIKLDIEGSNIAHVGWKPNEEDKKHMPEEHYSKMMAVSAEAQSKILFTNIKLEWDSCDCGGDYCCGHGDYVWQIHVLNEGVTHELEFEDNAIIFGNTCKYGVLPTEGATIYDFIRMCQLCDIELELSDYAVSLINI